MRGLELVFKDNKYSFQSLRALALTATGGGDVGECLTCIYRIPEGNDEGWYVSWRAMGEQVAFQAEKFASCGDHSSARECWFRASQYYRSAEFFLHGNLADPRINDTWRLSRNCFLEGTHLSDGLIQPVQIPYEKTSLPGYFCRTDNLRQSPLIIIHTGLDGTAEELYFSNAVLALKRGFNVLIFEGPGQGQVIHEQKLNFRSDWEKVLTPVVDYALQQKEVDPQRIALLGISFGGYLAARAAAFEHRLAALILDGGIYDYHAISMGPLWPRAEKWLDNPFFCCTLDRILHLLMKVDPGIRWGLNEGFFKFGAINPSEWFRMTRSYTMQEIAGLINCPTLVVDSEADKLCPAQSRRMYDALTCPKKFMLFTSAWGAQEHCQIGATFIANEQIYNWLMQTFNMLPVVNYS